MFGEISLIDGAPRTASVVSTTRSHVLGFFKADLMDLIEHAPDLGFKILYRLTQLLGEKLLESLTDFRSQEHQLRLRRRTTDSPAGQNGQNGSLSTKEQVGQIA